MTTALSPSDDVAKFFANYGSQIYGTGDNAAAFVNALEGENSAGAPVTGWKIYNSDRPTSWRELILQGIHQMQSEVPIYLQRRGSK